jgi:hypothetical protein
MHALRALHILSSRLALLALVAALAAGVAGPVDLGLAGSSRSIMPAGDVGALVGGGGSAGKVSFSD